MFGTVGACTANTVADVNSAREYFISARGFIVCKPARTRSVSLAVRRRVLLSFTIPLSSGSRELTRIPRWPTATACFALSKSTSCNGTMFVSACLSQTSCQTLASTDQTRILEQWTTCSCKLTNFSFFF